MCFSQFSYNSESGKVISKGVQKIAEAPLSHVTTTINIKFNNASTKRTSADEYQVHDWDHLDTAGTIPQQQPHN